MKIIIPEEEIDKKCPTDPLYLYQQDIDKEKSILSRKEEIEIAKKIEAAYFAMALILFSNNFGLKEFKKLFKRLRTIQIERFVRIGIPITQNVLNQKKKELLRLIKQINNYNKGELKSQEREALAQQIVRFDLRYCYLDEIEDKFRKILKIKKDENIIKRTKMSREIFIGILKEIDNFRQIIDSEKIIMVKRNLKLPILIAKRLEGRGIELKDLTSEGNHGLIKAIDNFDYRRGNRFISIAVYWIQHAMSREISEQGTSLRLPFMLQADRRNLNHIEKEIRKEEGREIDEQNKDFEEIKRRTGFSSKKLNKIIAIQPDMIVSLDAPTNDDGKSTISDLIPCESEGENKIRRHHIWGAERAMRILNKWKKDGEITERDYGIFTLRYPVGDKQPMTLDAVGEIFNLSRERIRQIERKILKKFSYRRAEIRAALE
ncbi:MAG: sigma-70 family RNA polymerase sigma factor [Patescibacteria group bacterium]|nr:sigma-70 family RNA polymerase sigma factor [Patescibacteria group bacterium]